MPEAGGVMKSIPAVGDGVGKAQTRTSQRTDVDVRLDDFAGTARVGVTRRCRREVRLT